MIRDVYKKGKLYSVPLADLKADPDQPRKFFDPQAMEELTSSVKQHGILEPILFRRDGDGSLSIVAGERRYLAAQGAGLAEVPAIYVEGDHAEISLVENLLRQDLTPVEESEALDRIMRDHGYKQEDLAAMIGKSLSTISESLSITKLPADIRDECRKDATVPKKVLVEIARSKQQRGMRTLYKKYREKNLSRDEVKAERKRTKKSPAQSIVGALDDLAERVVLVDATAWTEEERQSVQSALDALKKTVDGKLGTPAERKATPNAKAKGKSTNAVSRRGRGK